jgi:hypothetical protein
MLQPLLKAVLPFLPEIGQRSDLQKRPIPAHRSHALLGAYLTRRADVVPDVYRPTLYQLLARMPSLLDAAYEVAALPRIMPVKYSLNAPTVGAIEFMQSFYSAVPPMIRKLRSVELTQAGREMGHPVGVEQSLLQLPGVLAPEVIKALLRASPQRLTSARQLLDLPDHAQRLAALTGCGVSRVDAEIGVKMLEVWPTPLVYTTVEAAVPDLGVVESFMLTLWVRVVVLRPTYCVLTNNSGAGAGAGVDLGAGDEGAGAGVDLGDLGGVPKGGRMAPLPHWPLEERPERWYVVISDVGENMCVARTNAALEGKAWRPAEEGGYKLAAQVRQVSHI